MNNMWEKAKTKIFYVALSIGLIAFAGLVIVYNYQGAREDLASGEAIDLNQPVEEQIADGTDAEPEVPVVNNTKKEKQEEKTDEGSSVATTEDSAEARAVEAAEKENSEETLGVTSMEGAKAEESTLTYNGQQELAWPLIGDIILPYSMDTTVYFETLGVYKCNPGVMLRGTEGENVYAVYGGTVTEVKDTKEFGTVVTIDMGNGYEAKYGQLMNVCVKEGNPVATGQNIAEVGAVSDYYSKEGTNLYLAITKDGIPVNPISLIE